MTKETDSMKQFLNIVKNHCDANDINLYLSDTPEVTFCGTKCNGFFDEHSKKLAVAKGKEPRLWHATLVHEYGHMTQWLDQCEAWTNAHINHRVDTEVLIDLWLNHKIQLTRDQIKDYITRSRAVEADCEHRTIELIKKYNLPIGIEDYVRRANAYLYFWTTLKWTRKWYTIGQEPYNNDEILNAMPTKLLENKEYDIVSPALREKFEWCIMEIK